MDTFELVGVGVGDVEGAELVVEAKGLKGDVSWSPNRITVLDPLTNALTAFSPQTYGLQLPVPTLHCALFESHRAQARERWESPAASQARLSLCPAPLPILIKI